METPLTIKGTLDRFEEKLAIIKTINNTEILWPIIDLPENISVGSLS